MPRRLRSICLHARCLVRESSPFDGLADFCHPESYVREASVAYFRSSMLTPLPAIVTLAPRVVALTSIVTPF